jgi:hypothetical protein
MMQRRRRSLGIPLVLIAGTFGAFPHHACAGPFSPDTIANAPPGVGVGNGAPVSLADQVIDQYSSLGIQFPQVAVTKDVSYGTAITWVGGVKVWAPMFISSEGNSIPFQDKSVVDMGTVSFINGRLVTPGTNTPTTTSSLSIEVINQNPALWNILVFAFDTKGNLLGQLTDSHQTGSHGSDLLTIQAFGISSFFTHADPLNLSKIGNPDWGIAGLEFGTAPLAAPEPSGVVLLGLGMLGLAVAAGGRSGLTKQHFERLSKPWQLLRRQGRK